MITILDYGMGNLGSLVNMLNRIDVSVKIEKDPEKWLENSKRVEGSWWPKWTDWLKQYSGDLKNINEINLNNLKELYKAPGKYVLEK